MTIDKTLRIKRGTTSSRSVLTRVERIQKLKDTEKFTDETSPFGLPKVRVRKLALKKKKKEKKEGEEGAAPAAKGGATGKAAAGAKPAGAKPAGGKSAK